MSRWFTGDRQGATEGYQPRRRTCCPTAIMSSSRPLVWTPPPPRLAASPCRLSSVPSSDHSRFTLITCDRCERVWRCRGECSAAWTSSSLVILTGGLEGGAHPERAAEMPAKGAAGREEILQPTIKPPGSWCLVETSDTSYMVASAVTKLKQRHSTDVLIQVWGETPPQGGHKEHAQSIRIGRIG